MECPIEFHNLLSNKFFSFLSMEIGRMYSRMFSIDRIQYKGMEGTTNKLINPNRIQRNEE
jgi:hypothetical protein